MDEREAIVEYHICCECIHHISVPSNMDLNKWECACKIKRSEVNRSGGLTNCPKWVEL